MRTHPEQIARSENGSNLRRRTLEALLAHRAKLRAAEIQLYQKKAREFQRQWKKLFSKAELRNAAAIVSEVKKEFEVASFKAGHNAAKRDAIEIAAQKKLNRLLAKALPSFAKLQALKRAHLLEHAELVEAVLNDPATHSLTLNYGNPAVEESGEIQEFVAPFQIFDSRSDDSDGLIDHGGSFTYPDLSQVANALFFEHDEGSFTFNPLFITFSRVKSASSFASCGINFIMPATGQLLIRALLDNIANRVSFSVHDNFGLSYGNLDVRVQLFITVIRGSNVSHLTRVILAQGLRSQGGNLDYTMPILMSTAPYLVSGVTDLTFSAGENVQILVGTEVQVDSELDDMESKVNALMLWRLKKILVRVV